MLNKFKIVFWMIKQGYFLHLIYSLIFFFNKTLNGKIKFYERFSSEEAENLCKNFLVRNKEVYFFFSKSKNYKIKKLPQIQFRKINQKLGGGSDITLIYNLIMILKPRKIVEFGVANGWSTLSILLGCKKNKFGDLISIDMPYYFNNAKKSIGSLIKKEKFPNWTLMIGPQVNYINKINNQKYDFCHYDSDKSYQGRMMIYSQIWESLNKNGVLLSDDVSDNLAFFHFSKKKKKKPFVIQYKKKYLGILRK